METKVIIINRVYYPFKPIRFEIRALTDTNGKVLTFLTSNEVDSKLAKLRDDGINVYKSRKSPYMIFLNECDTLDNINTLNSLS